jgi:hypothetical protein
MGGGWETVRYCFCIDGAVSELYDVATIPGVSTPMALGFQDGDIIGFITHEVL